MYNTVRRMESATAPCSGRGVLLSLPSSFDSLERSIRPREGGACWSVGA
ncbi:MAG: hypothetical protein LBS92_00355 [Candidatus Methanoplasma sp.]|jgi:hypothetical protein|nr:hypothetical protein [Candidatus Methanoplasma sp.]